MIKVKQAHLLLKTLKQIVHRSDIFVDSSDEKNTYYSKRGFRILPPRLSSVKTWYNGRDYYLDRNALHASIYPTWNFLTYHDDKQYNKINHPAYEWLRQQEPEACKQWMLGYLKIYSNLPPEWGCYLKSNGIKKLNIKYYIE